MVDAPKASGPKAQQESAPAAVSASQGRTIFSLSEEETCDLGRAFSKSLKGGELILLEGELGLGKTVFARGIAAGLGIPPEDVSSPSFTLIQEYAGGRLNMFHVDLYRLSSPEDIATLGIEEILSSGGVVVIEWGEKLTPYYRASAITVRLHDVGEGSRRIELDRPAADGEQRQGDA
jgi:tRNA threonylcarbamoyladenosine biosynthesis protein TsaE